MTKTRIAYLRTQFWFNLKSGGSVGHTLGVLNGFRRNKCELEVVSNEYFSGIGDFNCKIIEPKIKKPRWLGELLYNFYAKEKFKKEISKFKPNFIYHRYTGYTFLVAKIAKELKIPLVLEFNSFDTWTMEYWGKSGNFFKRLIRGHLLYKIVKLVEIYNLKNASLIAVVSQPLKIDILKLGIPEEKILVNPNGVDPEKFSPGIEKSEKCKKLKQRLSIRNGDMVVGFVGTFGLWHGIPQLTEAIKIILNDKLLTNAHFLLIGDGELKSESEGQIGHFKEVTFAGTVPYSEIQYYLSLCDVLLSPHCPQADGGEFFGSPTKLFEYMAMEKGIVASRLGQIGKVLSDSETAILVEPGNIDELVEGTIKLAENIKLRETLGKKAREEVIKKHTWQKNALRLVERLNCL